MAARVSEDAAVYCGFLVFRARPGWHALAPEERRRVAERVEATLAGAPARPRGLYSLVGFRGDADLLLWAAADRVEDIQYLASRLTFGGEAGTAGEAGFGAAFETAAAYLAVAKRSPYTGSHVPAFLRGIPPQRHVIMYPFVKTAEWYLLPFEDRRRMMEEHGRAGAQWPQVFTNTLYAFGLGDYEFVVAFETERPADFLALLERLREVEVRRYTLRDTPIYLAARKPFWGVWEDLGVPLDRTALLLREPAASLAALAAGRRVTVLRRGGTKENAFGGVGDTLLFAAGEEEAGPDRAAPALAGRVEAVFDVTAPERLEALERVHPGAVAEARERFQWRGPGQALRALVVRAATLRGAGPLPEAAQRLGDWEELRAGVPLEGREEVLDDGAFAARLADVGEALAGERVEA